MEKERPLSPTPSSPGAQHGLSTPRHLRNQSGRVTQKMVAQALGLSSSTVGLVLGSCVTRHTKKLAPETVARIQAKAQEMGYHPDRAAQSIRSGRSNLIGVVHFGGSTEIALKANRTLAHHITASGYRHLAVDLSWHGHCVQRAIQELIEARVEGVVTSLISEALQAEHMQMLLNAGIPVISVNGDPRMGVPIICDDVESAFAQLTTHALDEGHEKHLIIIHNLPNRPMRMRQAGFERGMAGAKTVVFEGEEALSVGWPGLRASPGIAGAIFKAPHKDSSEVFQHDVYRLVRRLIETKTLPDVIYCPSDLTAFGVFAAAAECGIQIPRDLAVIGWGNYDYGRYPAYSLTTVDPNIEHSCIEAIKQMILCLGNGTTPTTNQLFESKLILRNSSKRYK